MFFGSNDGQLLSLLIGKSLGSTDGRMIGSDEVIKLGYNEGKVIDSIPECVYGISLGLDVGTKWDI